MLRKKLLQVVTIFLLVAITATSCKKDLFNEKDAIDAQSDLLNLKYSKDADILKLKFSNDLLLKNIDVQIKNIDLQIQRVADSAQFAMLRLGTTLKFSADSSLEKIKQANTLAQILQSYQNQRMLVLQADSLARGTAVFSQELSKASQVFYENLSKARQLFNDSIYLAASNKAAADAAIAESKRILRSMTMNYSVTIYDNNNFTVPGAKVSVYPYGSKTLLTVTADATGIARFEGLIMDPAAYFSVSATGYSGYLFQANYTTNFNTLGYVPITEGTETYQRVVYGRDIMLIDLVDENAKNAKTLATINTIKGSIKGNLDLTNGGLLEAVGGKTVNFSSSQTIKVNGSNFTGIYTIAAGSDLTTGLFSVKVPDGSWTASYDNTIEVEQKLFVNAWSDEDASKSVPSIRTIAATLATSGSSLSVGSGVGHYFTLPADSLTGRAVYLRNDFITPYSPTFTANSIGIYANTYTSSKPRLDSIGNFAYGAPSNYYFNNSSLNSNDNKSVMWSIKKVNDTLPLTLVSLVPGWVNTAPKLIALINNGKLVEFRLDGKVITTSWNPLKGAGGLFNNSAMFDIDNNGIYFNINANSPEYLANLAQTVASINATSFSLSGAKTVYLPIEYKSTISRARKPI